jgi:hypothetical protein
MTSIFRLRIEPTSCPPVVVAGGRSIQDVDMSVMESEIESGEKKNPRSAAGVATAIAVAALAILAVLGTHVGVIAMAALLVLGSILILSDRSITVEPHIMLT